MLCGGPRTGAAAAMAPFNTTTTSCSPGATSAGSCTVNTRSGPITALGLMLEDWLPAFSGSPAPGVPTLADGHRVQKVVDAARRSSDGEGWVKVP